MGHFDSAILEQVRLIGKKQIQSMSVFLKIRKTDWHEQGSLLKARINTKLSVYKAAVRLQNKSLSVLESDPRSVKRLVYEAVAILMDGAEACLLTGLRKLRMCEELFSSLLMGVAQIAVARGGQPLRIFLIRLKPIVLNVCAQADRVTTKGPCLRVQLNLYVLLTTFMESLILSPGSISII